MTSQAAVRAELGFRAEPRGWLERRNELNARMRRFVARRLDGTAAAELAFLLEEFARIHGNGGAHEAAKVISRYSA